MAELNCQMHVKTATDYDDIYLTSKSQLVEYDNTISGLSATNTKGAIDELARPTKILDVNGNEVLKFGATPNAVNEVTIRNNSTGYQPVVEATGNDTNIGLVLKSKGYGTIIGFIGSAIGFVVKPIANTTSAVNYLAIGAGATTVSPTIEAVGTDANIDVNLVAKGTGGVVLNKVNFTEASTLANIVSGESNTTLWGKVKKMFSFIGTTTLTTTAQTISTAINELVTKTITRTTSTGTTVPSAFVKVGETLSLKGGKVDGSLNILLSTAGVGAGGIIATLPVGYRPLTSYVAVCTLLNDARNSDYVTIDTSGNITTNFAKLQGTYIIFNLNHCA